MWVLTCSTDQLQLKCTLYVYMCEAVCVSHIYIWSQCFLFTCVKLCVCVSHLYLKSVFSVKMVQSFVWGGCPDKTKQSLWNTNHPDFILYVSTALTPPYLKILYKEDLGGGTAISETPEMERVKRNQQTISTVHFGVTLSFSFPIHLATLSSPFTCLKIISLS